MNRIVWDSMRYPYHTHAMHRIEFGVRNGGNGKSIGSSMITFICILINVYHSDTRVNTFVRQRSREQSHVANSISIDRSMNSIARRGISGIFSFPIENATKQSIRIRNGWTETMNQKDLRSARFRHKECTTTHLSPRRAIVFFLALFVVYQWKRLTRYPVTCSS